MNLIILINRDGWSRLALGLRWKILCTILMFNVLTYLQPVFLVGRPIWGVIIGHGGAPVVRRDFVGLAGQVFGYGTLKKAL